MLLDVTGLDVRYGRTHAVRNARITVGEGEIVTVLGANGAGKTSLLRALQGAVRPVEMGARAQGDVAQPTGKIPGLAYQEFQRRPGGGGGADREGIFVE